MTESKTTIWLVKAFNPETKNVEVLSAWHDEQKARYAAGLVCGAGSYISLQFMEIEDAEQN